MGFVPGNNLIGHSPPGGDVRLIDDFSLQNLRGVGIGQNNESNARADRMHDQVLSILTEVRELRERLAAMCVETRDPSPNYTAYEPEPEIEITPSEQQITHKYEQMDLDDILNTAPQISRPTAAHPLEGSAADGAPVGETDAYRHND